MSKSIFCRKTKSRPGDVYLPSFIAGQPAALDITIMSPLQASLISDKVRRCGFALPLAEDRKIGQYYQKCSDMGIPHFTPLALETFGELSKTTRKTLKRIALLSDKRFPALRAISILQLPHSSGVKCHACLSYNEEIRDHEPEMIRTVTSKYIFPLYMSKSIFCRKTKSRPGDVYLPSFIAGQPAALDITITSPLQASLISDAVRGCGFALTLAEDRKIGQYYQKCSDMGIPHFTPLALETFGELSKTTRKTLKRIALLSDKRFPALRAISILQLPHSSGVKCHACLSYNEEIRDHEPEMIRTVTSKYIFPLYMSKSIFCRKTKSRPGDVYLPSFIAGQPAALDITITSPLQASLISDAVRGCGFALTLAEDRKIGQYYQKCSDMGIPHFTPLALETFGELSKTTRKTLKRIALLSDKRFPALRAISILQLPHSSGVKCHACLSYNEEIRDHEPEMIRTVTSKYIFPLYMSKSIFCRKTKSRPGDVYLPSFIAGQPAALDITITSPLQASLISDAVRGCGFALTLAEDRKIGQFYQKCSDMGIPHFTPLALETFGELSKTTRKTLKRIALLSDKRFPALRAISILQSPHSSGVKCHACLSYNEEIRDYEPEMMRTVTSKYIFPCILANPSSAGKPNQDQVTCICPVL